MKRLVGLASLLLAFNTMCVSAAPEISVSGSHSADNMGNLSHNVIVRIVEQTPGANTMMVVKAQDGTPIAIDQAYAQKDGSLSFNFECYMPGNYSGYINTEINPLKQSFDFNILSDYEGIITEFKSADESTILDVIERNKDNLLFDTKYFTPEYSQKISDNILADKEKIDITNITQIYDKSVLYAYLFSDIDTEDKLKVIAYYDPIYLSVINQTNPKNIYASFLEFDENQIDKVFDLIKEAKPELSKFRDTFNPAVVRTAFATMDDDSLDEFVLKNLDYVAFNGYEDKTPLSRKKILAEVKAVGPTTIQGFINAYNAAIQEPTDPAPGGSSGGGTGGSSGGSSGGSGGGSGGNTGGSSGGSNGGSGGSSSGGQSSGKEDKTPTVWAPPILKGEGSEETEEQAEKVSAFKDLGNAEWAKDAVVELQKKGILSGKADGVFAPFDNVTRAEFTTMIVKAFLDVDENAACDFSDISKDDWSYKYVATGNAMGIIYGLEDGSFGKNVNITREDMATILYRVLSFTKAIPSIEKVNNRIADFDSVSEYAKNSVLMLSEMGIINGIGDGNYAPKSNATRAQATVIINNAMKVVAK